MAIGYMGLFMDATDELDMRDILDKNLKTKDEIIESKDKLGDYGYSVFRLCDPLIKGDSGIFGTRKPQAPYVILVADYVVIMFTNYSKFHKTTNVLGWEINKDEDINTYWKDKYVELEINVEEFHDFRKQIIESCYAVFNPNQEKEARLIREKERSDGKVMRKADFYKIMQALKSDTRIIRVRQAYRFRCAYMKMLEARKRGEMYNYLHDRELMLTQNDVDNYIEDLKNVKNMGIHFNHSLLPESFCMTILYHRSRILLS